jgi:pyruvate-formate lyase-activating enzyme
MRAGVACQSPDGRALDGPRRFDTRLVIQQSRRVTARGRHGAPGRLLLVEFAAVDRFHRAILFPFVQGYARTVGWQVRWLRHGVRATAREGEAEGGVGLPPDERDALRSEAREYRPELVLFNLDPSSEVRAAAAAGGGRLAVLSDRQPLDELLGRSDPWVRGAGLFQNVVPDHACRLANRLAEGMEQLPFVLLGEECTYARPFRASPLLASLSFEGCLRSGGCAFCGRPASSGRWREDPVELLQRQLGAIERTLPVPPASGLKIRLVGEAALDHLDAVAEAGLRFGLRPLALLLDGRADRLLASARAMREALQRLQGQGVRLELCLVGVENFSAAELERLNKGLSPAVNLRAIRLLLELERDFPDSFGFRAHGGLSLISMNPWTRPVDLALNLAVVQAIGLEGLVGKLFTGRLRLFAGLPLLEAARRDGLLLEGYSDPLLDTARRNLYAMEHPWRFALPEMEPVSRVLVRLDREAPRSDDSLTRALAAWDGEVDRGVTPKSLAAALALLDTAIQAAWSGESPGPEELVAHAWFRLPECGSTPRFEDWTRHAAWRRASEPDQGGMALEVMLAHKPVMKVEPLTAEERDLFLHDAALPNVGSRRRGHGAGPETFEVFLGREAATVAEALELAGRIEREPPGAALQAAIARMGGLLGYPRCCAEAFVSEPPNLKDNAFWLHVARRLALPGPVPVELNPMAPWLEYVPCGLGCQASLARARRVLADLGEHGRAMLDRCHNPLLLLREVQGQFLELLPETEPGERFRFRAKAREGGGPLARAVSQGDELVLEGEQCLVLRSGRPWVALSGRAFLWWHARAFQSDFWAEMLGVLRVAGAAPRPAGRVFGEGSQAAREDRGRPTEPGLDSRSPLLRVAPAASRWVRELVDGLRRIGAPVRSACLDGGALRVSVESSQGERLVAVVTPRRQGAEGGWRSTRYLDLGYEGQGELGPTSRRWLETLHGLLVDLEARVPTDLQGFAALAARHGPPEHILRALFPFVTVERSDAEAGPGQSARSGEGVEVLVRVTRRCNQACPFCSAPEHAEPTSEVVRACFRAAADLLPGALLSLTGGEPTLRAGFVEEVRSALGCLTLSRIQIQTNAVQFASRLEARALEADPRLAFFVSLHALDEAVYDRCTGTHGQLPLAIRGVQGLLDAGHPVTLNTVVCQQNVGHLEDLVGRLPDLFPKTVRPALHFSVLVCPEWNPGAAAALVRYTQVVAALEGAARLARRLGVDLLPLRSSTHAALPACLVGEEHRAGRVAYQIAAHETGYEEPGRPFVKAVRCRSCRETPRCLGVPQAYARAFGLEELVPL